MCTVIARIYNLCPRHESFCFHRLQQKKVLRIVTKLSKYTRVRFIQKDLNVLLK